jgi:hypothetical protein
MSQVQSEEHATVISNEPSPRPHPPLEESYALLQDMSGIEPRRLKAASLLIEVVSEALSRGSDIHYLGSSDRLKDIRAVLQLSGRGLRMRDWQPTPLGRIGRFCREAFPEVLDQPKLLMEALGLTCLPMALIQMLLRRQKDHPVLLVMDGVDVTDRDVQLAVNAMSAYCKRAGLTLAIFP